MDDTQTQNPDDLGSTREMKLDDSVVAEVACSDCDDVTLEEYSDDEGSGGAATPADRMRKLRERIATLTAEKQEYLDGWQRLKADFANYRRRENEDRGRVEALATEKLVVDLMPALDAFASAMGNKEAWEKVDPNWRIGVEYIHGQIISALTNHGVMPIAPVPGDAFDHHLHAAIATVETKDEGVYHRIAELVQPGYRLGEKLLRPAKVRVYVAEGETMPA